MHVSRTTHRALLPLPATPRAQGSVVTLGNFDGMHLGHQALIQGLRRIAKPLGLSTHVVTFTPHPRDYFAAQGRGSPVLGIGNVRDRLERLAALGVDHVHLLRFNHALATLSPHDFVARVLVAGCHAKQVVVGHDVRFGHQRTGDLALLKALGERYGFTVSLQSDVLHGVARTQAQPQAHSQSHPQSQPQAQRVSSSAVRAALQAGDLATARALLGYDLSHTSRVIHGRKLGRTLNCPTLNLIPRLANPAFRGIAVVAVDGLNENGALSLRRYGVASLGLRPTVEQTTRFSLEVHVFDWSGDAYGQRLRVTYLHKLRDEAAYVDLATLQAAIAQDMRAARAWLGSHGYPVALA